MRIAILSDIHDNLWKLDVALPAVQHCDEMICCGDLCSPFVIDALAQGFTHDIHLVFGNNDADLFRITAKNTRYPNLHLYGEICELERAGKRFAINHFDTIARPIAQGGSYDVVCFGHNHDFEITRYGKTLALNPGSILARGSAAAGVRIPTRLFLCSMSNRGIHRVMRFRKTVTRFARRLRFP